MPLSLLFGGVGGGCAAVRTSLSSYFIYGQLKRLLEYFAFVFSQYISTPLLISNGYALGLWLNSPARYFLNSQSIELIPPAFLGLTHLMQTDLKVLHYGCIFQNMYCYNVCEIVEAKTKNK